MQVVGIEWYDGLLGYAEPSCPVLAICLDNGRMQLMRSESDDNAVCIDTGIKPVKCKWNCNGTILAVAGYQLGGSSQEARELWMVQVCVCVGVCVCVVVGMRARAHKSFLFGTSQSHD